MLLSDRSEDLNFRYGCCWRRGAGREATISLIRVWLVGLEGSSSELVMGIGGYASCTFIKATVRLKFQKP